MTLRRWALAHLFFLQQKLLELTAKPRLELACPPHSNSMSTFIESAQQLAQAGQHREALAALDKLPSEDQTQVSALYVRAVCLRRLDRRAEALNCLKQILQADPEHVRAYQELGHVHVAARNAEKAAFGYSQAVARDPALLSSWTPLVQLYKMLGDEKNSQLAQRYVDELSALPPELLAAKSFLNQGDLDSADQICRAFMREHKQHVEGLRVLAQIATQAQILDDAEFMLDSAVVFDPKHIGAKFDLATVQLKRQKFAAADAVAKELVQLEPDNDELKTLLGSTRMGVGDTEGAIACFNELINKKRNLKSAYLLSGHAHKTAGNFEQSVAAYQALYQHTPDFGDAFWSLANTKTYQFTPAEIAHMLDYEQRTTTSVVDRVHFCFALGKAYEDQADYDRSFEFYERGNRLNAQRVKGASPDITKRVARQIEVCDQALFAQYADAGCGAPDPIFIVGLPRAGSTLLEQILASHSQIDGTHELPDILGLSRRLRGRAAVKVGEEPRYPAILRDIDPELLTQFGEQYIENTRVFRQAAPLFIDKMPNNFLHIGLIKLILPNAKIIDARRHPMSCCFSGFKQLFAEGQEFTYGLREIGEYYREYVRLMDHWDRVLPGAVLRVQHEDVVSDLDTQVRRMLDFCGLEFEQACIDFYKTKRNVRTPSAEQVRQPIFTTALEQWRHFETHLEPLKKALGDEVLARYPL